MAHPVPVPQWQLDPDYQKAEVLVCKFMQSFILAISIAPPSSNLLLRGAPDYSTDTVSVLSELHAEANRQLFSKGLAQGPYVAARAGIEPTTLRLRVIDLTNTPPRPTMTYEKELLS